MMEKLVSQWNVSDRLKDIHARSWVCPHRRWLQSQDHPCSFTAWKARIMRKPLPFAFTVSLMQETAWEIGEVRPMQLHMRTQNGGVTLLLSFPALRRGVIQRISSCRVVWGAIFAKSCTSTYIYMYVLIIHNYGAHSLSIPELMYEGWLNPKNVSRGYYEGRLES